MPRPGARSRPEWWMLTFPIPGMQEGMAQFAEAVGWDGLVFADTQNLAADVYSSLALAAVATNNLQLGTGVTNPLTRHPAVTAAAIATVQVASGGRAVLGIGRGDSSLAHLGRAPVPPDEFERHVVAVQQYLRGVTADLGDGVTSRSEWIGETGLPKVPVDVAATGPKVIGVGARHAERVTFAVGADAERITTAIATARDAAVAADRDPDEISFGAYVNVVVHPDVETARSMVRGGLASFAHFSGMAGAPNDGLADAATFRRLGADYELAGHGKAGTGHSAALPDDFVDRFGVVGPSEHCEQRLQELVDCGLDRLVVIGGSRDVDGGELLAANRRLMNEVAPQVRAAG